MNQRKKKIILISASIIGGILLLALIIILFFAGPVLRKTIQAKSSQLTGCSIQIEKLSVNLLTGKVYIKNLDVGNPEGFKTSRAFHLGELMANAQVSSIFGKQFIIQEIRVINPEVTLELGAKTNLNAILDQIQKNSAPQETSDSEVRPPVSKDTPDEELKTSARKEKGKGVWIQQFSVQKGKVSLAASFLGNNAISLPLPPITLKDIGKEKEMSLTEATVELLQKCLESILALAGNGANALKSLGSGLGEGLKGLFK